MINKRQAGFNKWLEVDNSCQYSGYYMIGLASGISFIGKIKEETSENILLLPHVIYETPDIVKGEPKVYRAEERIPMGVRQSYVTFKQPISDSYINKFLRIIPEVEKGEGI